MASEHDQVRKRNFLKPALAPYFELFGLPYTADLTAVKGAYRRLARLFHPDLNPNQDTSAQMQKINDAYERLIRFFKDETS